MYSASSDLDYYEHQNTNFVQHQNHHAPWIIQSADRLAAALPTGRAAWRVACKTYHRLGFGEQYDKV